MRHVGLVAALAFVPPLILSAHKAVPERAAHGADEIVLEDAQALKEAGRAAEQKGQLQRARELYGRSQQRYVDAYSVDHPLAESVENADEVVWRKMRSEAIALSDDEDALSEAPPR